MSTESHLADLATAVTSLMATVNVKKVALDEAVLKSTDNALAAALSTLTHRAAFQTRAYTSFTTSGTGTEYKLTPFPALLANGVNVEFDVTLHVAAGALATMSVSGLPALPLKFKNAAGHLEDLLTEQAPQNWTSSVYCDGQFWIVKNVVFTMATTAAAPAGSLAQDFFAKALTTALNASFNGVTAGKGNGSGAGNSAMGSGSLLGNTTGYDNSAFGRSALLGNTTGYNNVSVGVTSLAGNTTGIGNVGIGVGALVGNTTGVGNTSMGTFSMTGTTTGYKNTAVGHSVMTANTTGYANVGVGHLTLGTCTTGYENTAVGNAALFSISTGFNNTAIGFDAQVPTATGSNQVRIGNVGVSYAAIQVPWTITSDRKYKHNIVGISLGMDFIKKLRPVEYFRIGDESGKKEMGFIAQEMKAVLGETDLGLISYAPSYDALSVRYNDIIPILVKALQELKDEFDAYKVTHP